jgi:hypothetical protein
VQTLILHNTYDHIELYHLYYVIVITNEVWIYLRYVGLCFLTNLYHLQSHGFKVLAYWGLRFALITSLRYQ